MNSDCLPISVQEYETIARQIGFRNIKIADWTQAVSPFWKAVARSALKCKSILGLMHAGWPTVKGAQAMNLMIRGYRSGLIRFGLLQGMKGA